MARLASRQLTHSVWGSLDRRQRRVLVTTLTANALIFFDQTAVIVALPSIQRQFHTSTSAEQWIITAYLLPMAGCMPLAGRFADHFDRKVLLLMGIALFGISAAACAAAPSIGALIAARFVQGIGGSLVQPLALGNATRAVSDHHRGWAIGLQSTGGTTFLALGPLVAGGLLEVTSWRWIFVLNLPVVAFAFLNGLRSITRSRETHPLPVGGIGFGLLFIGLASLVLGITQLDQWGPTALIWVGGGAAVLAFFAVHELRSAHPVIDLRLLGVGLVRASLIALFAIQFVVLGTTVYLVLYLQHGLAKSALVTGLLLALSGIFTPLLSITTGRITDQRGPRGLMLSGLCLAAAGLVGIGLAAPSQTVYLLVPGLLVYSLARPAIFTPASVAPLATLGPERRGVGASLVTEARQVGSVLGIAVFGAVFAAAGGAGLAADPATLADGFRLATLAGAGVVALAAVASWRLMPRSLSARSRTMPPGA